MSQLTHLSLEEYERAANDYCRSLPLEHFMEAIPQSTQREFTLESLALLKARRPDIQVYNELLIQYLHEGRLRQVVPDNMIVLSDKRPRSPGSFNVELETAGPFWVLDYVSPASERKDYQESFRKYEQELCVPYCLMFYPERQDLQIWRHAGDHYEALEPNLRRLYEIPELELEIGLRDGWVRFWHQGQLLELPAELQQRLEQERQRAEQERQRAEQERQRADEEKKNRLAAEARADQLQALLDQFKGKNPPA